MSDPTTTPPLDLAELRRLAEAVNGPCVSMEVRRAWADVAHPATLLTLLDRLEGAEAERDRLRAGLLRVAARSDDPDTLARVADALGLTLEQLREEVGR